MALHSGVRLSRYEVGPLLGAGGMGEVYQARDSSLARDVAIKVIPDAFARDPERLARFEREAKVQISTEGGIQPRWSRDCKELFYRNGEKMIAAEISTGSGFMAGAPKVLFVRQYANGAGTTMANYDVTPDGHFVMVKTEPARLNVVLNWFEELKRKVPIP